MDFGEKFQSHISKTAKSKEKSRELFSLMSPNKQPFRKGPLSSGKFKSNRGQYSLPYNNNNRRLFAPSSTTTSSRGGGSQQPSSNRGGFRQRFNQNRGKKFSETLVQQSPRFSRMFQSGQSKSCSKEFIPRSISTSPTSRTVKVFPYKLEKTNSRSKYSFSCAGLSNPFSHSTKTRKKSFLTKNEFGRTKSDSKGNSGDVTEGCNKTSLSHPGSIFKQHIFSEKEGRGKPPSNKLEKPKQVYSLSTFQNGGSTFIKRNVAGERLYVQTRPERCLFQCSPFQDIKEICSLPLVREPLRVPLPVFRPRASTTCIYKTAQNSNSIVTQTTNSSNNLFGRYALDVQDCRGITSQSRHYNFSPPTFRVCDKSEKVPSDSLSKNRISGFGNRFPRDEIITDSKENRKHYEKVQCCSTGSTFVSQRTDKIIRDTFLNNTGSITCKTPVSLLTTGTSSSFEKGERLRKYSGSQSVSQGRTLLVDEKYNSLQRSENTNFTTRSDYKYGCFHGGLGGIMSGDIYRRPVVQDRESLSYKCVRTHGSEFSNPNFHKVQGGEILTPENRQHDSSFLFVKNGGNKEHPINKNFKGDMVLLDPQKDHNYSRIYPQFTECRSGLGVQKFPGQERMEAKSYDFQKFNTETRDSRCRPLCLETVSSDSDIHVLETRSFQYRNRCTSANLEKQSPICISPLFINRPGLSKSQEGKSKINLSNTNLAYTSLVSCVITNVNKKSNIVAKTTGLTAKPWEGGSSFSGKIISKTSGVASFKQHLSSEGVSERAAELITSARRQGSISNYESAWGKWVSWCSQWQINPFRSDINYILDYLANLFEKGLEYNTINLHRSAISAYHEPILGISVGKHRKVCNLLTGVFNKRPPKPRYTFVWDVEIVLKYFLSLPDSENLSDKLLTFKITMLLALSSASRSSELKNLDLQYMAKSENLVRFYFHQLSKTNKKGKPIPPLEFYKFEEQSKLCVVSTLFCYIERTSKWRSEHTVSQLLLSFIKPHKAVKSCTISGWLKKVLQESGINVDIFKPHSTRSASTSKAKSSGISTKDILKRGNWSNKSTWQKFYNKEIKSNNFQAGVFALETL